MLFSKNSVITVYHRSRSGRTMKLAIDASTAIAEPLKDDAGSWTVPCDIIGYNGASKGRLPKARFNLAAFEADDEDLQKAIGEALQTLVDQFIGTDWSVKVLYTAADVQELQQELISQTGEVMFHNDSVVVNWILDASVTPLVRRCSCLLSSASISVSPPAENGGAQLVRVDVNSVSAEAWLEMQFALSPECTPIRSDSSHRLTTIIPGKDSEEVAVRLTLQRFQNNNDIDSEALGIRRAVPSCASGQIYSSMNLDSIQLQISALRAEIDASIRDLTTGNAQASPRPCNIMFQNRERGCFLRVSGESPISNEDLQSVEAAVGETVPELIQPANPRPLTVNVSASSPTNVPDGKLSSPSGSIDSGISSPVADSRLFLRRHDSPNTSRRPTRVSASVPSASATRSRWIRTTR
ncbi:hypothetical protein L596_028317 [Steinernema carpocapsae]|uniref:Uncharacterized protein n=1 Tax=Steinernema carpocapsae TaxID=34508 RepID=A0A4U5LY48_STECR|nr:hypothetical protein L596_028317 [Steinernema carpocapsae]